VASLPEGKGLQILDFRNGVARGSRCVSDRFLPAMESHILGERMRNLAESLFWEIFYRREAVRAELGGLFQVSAATVSRAVGILLSKQLVIEFGAPVASRGRRPTLLRINPRLAYVGGIEMDRDRITAVVTDLGGNLLGRGATAASPANAVEATLRDAAKVLRIAMKDAGLRQMKLARIGVGHTGTLDVDNGLCLDWEGASTGAACPWRRRCGRLSKRRLHWTTGRAPSLLACNWTFPNSRTSIRVETCLANCPHWASTAGMSTVSR
jgi:hypothetical protein